MKKERVIQWIPLYFRNILHKHTSRLSIYLPKEYSRSLLVSSSSYIFLMTYGFELNFSY